MDFQPNIGQDVYVTTLDNQLMLCTYLGMTIRKDFSCAHVYKHKTSDTIMYHPEQVGILPAVISSKFN